MPATEKTWRDQTRMHVIFGVSALVMLAGTIWMLAKDHNREWRRWQLDDRAKERWAVEAQLAQMEANSSASLERLSEELRQARSAKVDDAFINDFIARVEAEDKRLDEEKNPEAKADFTKLKERFERLEAAEEGSDAARKAREQVLASMNQFVREAKRRENALLSQKKFVAADQTAIVSTRGLAVGEGKPTKELEARISELSASVAELDARLANAKDYRVGLEQIVRDVQLSELEIEKQIAAMETDLNRLRENVSRNPANPLQAPGEWINRAPVLDALYTGNIKLDQIWLPEMKINYNFSSVARYDRCVVCHRAIDKTAPGSATEPAYPAIPRDERIRTVELPTPEEQPKAAISEKGETGPEPSLLSVYGLMLSSGQVNADDITIQVVAPESRSALAGLQSGDVILEMNSGPILSEADAKHYLLDSVAWGKPVTLKIRRGLNQPFTSHPRLDLFVGPSSPHKKGEMGCTICHDGQGSATEFKWASHTPNDPHQALRWSQDPTLQWFDNHHWIFPMMPARFMESNCLKCHHDVVELKPSERFPEPPAPKLVKGYELVRDFGCYGCHEIPGFDGPTKRIGPDMRLEPNVSEVASQILSDPNLSDEERNLASQLVADPSADEIRQQLALAIRNDVELAAAAKPHSTNGEAPAEPQQPRLSSVTHTLLDLLKDVEAPGRFRKPGPSLRHLDSKVDYNWLYNWIRRPADFRPTTRMPQFFLHYNHLDGHEKAFKIHDAQGKEQLVTDRELTAKFEHIEIRALSEFLLANSQPFTYIEPMPGITEQASADRGKWLFQSRGCLACHTHKDFPGIASNQGPDLSRLQAKFNNEKGQRWLYSWLREPHHYHARTAMPNLYLEPIQQKDASGNPTGQVSDPAADIMAFLLSVPSDWKPEIESPRRNEFTAAEVQELNDLTTVWLSASFPRRRAERFAQEGIDERLRDSVKVDERVLIGPFKDEADRAQRQLEYVARRSLSRYGCFGCHDIPGFEAAKPIGTPLASWGRKDPAQLAFENIGQFLATHGIDGDQDPHAHGNGEAAPAATDPSHGGGHHGVDPLADNVSPDTGFFLQSLLHHQRQGFLWQKLRMPRSFDFETTKTKRYDERLRMPKFPFNEEEREAVMTFVLGLTNEAPAERYIYKPDARQEAIVQGRFVLDKFNCAGCHVLDMERWDVAFAPATFEEPPTTSDFPFLDPSATSAELKTSLTPDRRGLLSAELHGMPVRNEETGAPRMVDIDGVPIEPDDTESAPHYEFQLFRPTIVDGIVRKVGVQNLRVPADRKTGGPANGQAFPGEGGDLAKYLYPHVIAEERKTNPNVDITQAWGWLPPPLHHEGEKVQTGWLHDFLMDPTVIRPAVVLRMPNFRMTSDEASKLVNYFAAKDNVDFPYEYNSRRRGGYLAEHETAHPELFNDAMKIVTNGNFCVKCHSVGDFQVRGVASGLGPDLDEVYRRLRPDYVRRWIANPQRILPYTGMPVNIPFAAEPPNFGGVDQALFHGTSFNQLDGLVDLLMNFDEYTKRQTSVKSLVTEPTAPAEPAGEPQAGEPRAGEAPPNDRSASN